MLRGSRQAAHYPLRKEHLPRIRSTRVRTLIFYCTLQIGGGGTYANIGARIW